MTLWLLTVLKRRTTIIIIEVIELGSLEKLSFVKGYKYDFDEI